MQFADFIREAASRIDEATAVFRFKSRHATGEFEHLGAHWSDSRSKRFDQHFIQPQRNAMEEGERLCRRYSELADNTKTNAQEAENEIGAFLAIAEEYESVALELLRVAEIAGQLSKQAMAQSHSLISEIHALNSAISGAEQDPG